MLCMKTIIIAALISIVTVSVQPLAASNDNDTQCVDRAYKIGYDLSKTNNDTIKELSQLEADCIYSGKTSEAVKCLVWLYDIEIRIGADERGDVLQEQDLYLHQCTNLDSLTNLPLDR